MNKNILFLAAFALFASCKKNNVTTPEDSAPETIKEIKFDVANLTPSASVPVKQGDAKYSFIGYGYDITGKYADVSSVKSPVFDVAAYSAAYPQRISLGQSTSGGFNTLYAENAEDYLRRLTDKFDKNNDRNLFTSTITSVFPGEDATTKDFIYAQYTYSTTWKALRTYWSDAGAKNYLTAEFKNDAQRLKAEDLVKKYGTHILSQITLGAKFNVYYQAKTSDSRKFHSSRTGFTYALDKLFKIPSGNLDDLKPADINAISQPKLVYETLGGNLSEIVTKETTKGNIIWFYDWIKTSTADNAVFIDILPAGLTPLQDMIDDEAKKTDVKNYILSYIGQYQIKL